MTETNVEPQTIMVGTGMPAASLLDYFGEMIYRAYGEFAYLVGSATTSKSWRDVDVRLILDDERYEALFGSGDDCTDAFWSITTASLSLLAQKMTGLPIDFQIQRRSEARKFDGPRMPIGLFVERRRVPVWMKQR